jgi:hypothetical protein
MGMDKVKRGRMGQTTEAAELKKGPRGSPLFKGHERITIFFQPAQAAALRSEALRRATEAGVTRPDMSQIVRELVDAWIAKSAKR